MTLVETITTYWIEYVFGSVLYSGIFLMLAILFLGMRRGWSLDVYAVLFVPLMFIMANSLNIFPQDISLAFGLGIAVLIGLAAISLIRR